jgi:hypothetical protein
MIATKQLHKNTKIMKTYIPALAVMAIASSISFAQEAPKGPREGRPNPEAMFKRLDKDSSGSLSLEEFKQHPRAQQGADKAAEAFAKMDKDSSGEVSLEEFTARRPARERQGGERRKRDGGGGGAAAE